jgi:hypothetical protein
VRSKQRGPWHLTSRQCLTMRNNSQLRLRKKRIFARVQPKYTPTVPRVSNTPSTNWRGRETCAGSKAPWRLVEKTAIGEGGVLEIRRSHAMVNRWNKAIAVGLRHNHDMAFTGTQSRTMAIVFFVTNYATNWKIRCGNVRRRQQQNYSRIQGTRGSGTKSEGGTRKFLARLANRIFTERALSQVGVVAHLLGFGMEFTHNKEWAYLNVRPSIGRCFEGGTT